MNDIEKGPGPDTLKKYKLITSVIMNYEKNLRNSEFFYLALNVVVLLFTITFTSNLLQKANYFLTYSDYAFIFILLTIGMMLNVYWVAFAMRLQLKLKLRYFQARAMERKMESAGEHMFSDENIFFDPEIRRLVSHDNKEELMYPTKGLARMDGFAGSAKPRHFSWLLPGLFFSLDFIVFILVVTTV